jgi:ABC-2 type transport system permease protein
MSKVLLLIAHELRLLLKDRQALALLFLMPLAFIVFLTLALQDIYLAKVGQKMHLEVVTGSQCDKAGSICADLLAELRRMEYHLETSPTATMSRQLTLILPEDLKKTVAAIKNNRALENTQKIQLLFDPTLDQSLRALVQTKMALALQSVLIAQIQKEIADVQKKLPKGFRKISTVADVNHVSGLIEEKALGGFVLPNPIQQTVPAWALFGMFFIVIPMANSMIRDRKLGVFKRLLSFPVRRTQIIAGKIVPFLVLNVLQFLLMFAVGVFVLPRITNLQLVVDWNPWHVLAVTVVCAFAATSYGLMVACLARTTEQASAFGSLSVVILAIAGGVMIPRFVMPDFMQKISQLSPLYWALESYLDIIVRKAAFTLTLQKILVLVGFAAACLGVALSKFRWSEAD